ncbi:site-specific integrase [Companilactobacillus sp.]|uniref:tyrosine-type recombinase/integrase n=1 Tax=Companilactobacillus sp. TaxID=2767905 RepID=UPI00262D3E0F|nr:site-specific integrase [Companilactobacillus sp.]
MAQIFQRNNTWGYRVWLDSKHSKSKSGFKRRKDAYNAAIELEDKRGKNLLSEDEGISFPDYFNKWIKTYKLGRLDRTTESKYITASKVITEYFEGVAFKDVATTNYQTMLDDYAKNHAKDTTRRFNSYIKKAVKYAINDGIIYRDFTFGAIIDGLKSKDSSLKFLEIGEAEALKKVCIETWSLNSITRAEILFGLLTGCRYGEVAGLTWDCVDLNKQTVTINKSYDYVSRSGFKPTKTETSNRTISISDETTDMLETLLEQQDILFKKHHFKNPNKHVFINNRHQVPSGNAVNKTLAQILNDISAKNIITFHGLRHTHASLLIAHGISIDYISERLGHSNVSMTYRVYTHLLENVREKDNENTMDFLNNL